MSKGQKMSLYLRKLPPCNIYDALADNILLFLSELHVCYGQYTKGDNTILSGTSKSVRVVCHR